MRRAVLLALCLVLAALLALRAGLPAAAEGPDIVTDWDETRYNVLPLTPASPGQTAGSALVAELDRYFFSRTPSEKSAYTGALAGKDLLLILAEDWQVGQINETASPALYRLWSEGARFGQCWAPDWYQDRSGREFALLAGLTPTAVRGETALAWAGEQGTCLPFALARLLTAAGYSCRAYPGGGRAEDYEALGFTTVDTAAVSDLEALSATLPGLMAASPFFGYYRWSGSDGGMTLSWLLWALEEYGHGEDTAVCLLTGCAGEADRQRLFLWGGGLPSAEASPPCSELDVAPTLLDLLGVGFDARFLSGRDLFAAGEPLVSLTGSAYGDWVTDKGRYRAAEELFLQLPGSFSTQQEAARYVQQMRRQVYDRYVYVRRAMENNYFRAVAGG